MRYRLRLAEPKDVPAIEERCREQNKRDGTSYPVPTIFDDKGKLTPKVAVALVIEDEHGHIRQGVVFEKTGVEMCLYGCDPKATASLKREIEGAFYLLRNQGFEMVNTTIPHLVVSKVQNPLFAVGFTYDNSKFAHFSKDLTKIEDTDVT